MTYGYLIIPLPQVELGKTRVNQKDFIIPSYSDYPLLFKYNYTIPQLKQICNMYKLPRSGTKHILLMHVYNYLYYSHHIIKLQKYVRGYLQRRVNKLRGPAYYKREKCVNDSDFFTLDPIKKIVPTQFFSIEGSDGFIYGFDILSLWQLFDKAGIVENPYNRQPFPPETRDTLVKLIKLNNNTNIILTESNFDIEKELEMRIVAIFQFINALGHYTDHSWFLSLDKIRLIRFFREIYDIWNHRAQINENIKLRIYPNGDPFRVLNRAMLTINSSLYDLRKICACLCENLTYYGITDDDKNIGAYYILTALTLQSYEASIALPWLYQSVI
jgi:hypothetical protein